MVDEIVEIKSYWLYYRPPDTFGWRLALNLPLRDIPTATAIKRLLETQFDTEREFAVREDGKNQYRKVK